jgi:chemotaxis family two-component system response regulator Rcp1
MYLNSSPAKILLVEDNSADVRLTRESLKDCRIATELFVAKDGEDAIKFLCQEGKHSSSPRPDLVLLDLNLPGKTGRDVLSFAKGRSDLKEIPVIILTSSRARLDILQTYEMHANCYISKPLDLQEFSDAVRAIELFWFSIAQLPRDAAKMN